VVQNDSSFLILPHQTIYNKLYPSYKASFVRINF